MTHKCVTKSLNLPPLVSGNGLSPGRRQTIIWANAGIVLIGTLKTNLSEIFNQNWYIFIQENAFENIVWKMAAILSRPQCIKKNVQASMCRSQLLLVWEYSLQWRHNERDGVSNHQPHDCLQLRVTGLCARNSIDDDIMCFSQTIAYCRMFWC